MTDETFDYEDEDEDDLPPSKTQIKKEMHALLALGVAISELTEAQKAKIPMSDRLRKSIDEAPKIKGNSAKKRHRQFIGKLMRSEDNTEAIENAYEDVMQDSHKATQQHHVVEQWRDTLLKGEHSDLENFIERYPSVERQHLRQLVRASHREQLENKTPVNTRKLFRFLRDTIIDG